MPSDLTLPPTPRRLARARREGDHPISLAVTRLAGIVCAAALLPLWIGSLVHETRELLGLALRGDVASGADGLALRVIGLVAPILVAVAVLAVALGVWQTGGAVSSTPLAWSWQRLNPFAAFGRFGSFSGLLSALSLTLMSALFLTLALSLLRNMGPELASSIGDFERTALLIARSCQRLLWWAVAIGIGSALIDALLQRGAWLRRHRMSHQERRREERENEGDAVFRQERRQAHRELLDAAELARIPGATLIVFDWPQLGVALRYDAERDRAPIVVVQVVGAATSTARSAAELYAVATVDDPALARRLARLPLDSPIPSSLFADVAAALEPWARERRSAAGAAAPAISPAPDTFS